MRIILVSQPYLDTGQEGKLWKMGENRSFFVVPSLIFGLYGHFRIFQLLSGLTCDVGKEHFDQKATNILTRNERRPNTPF